MTFEFTAEYQRLAFDEGPLSGLEVIVRWPSTEASIELENLPASFDGRLTPFRSALEALARLLVSWNLTENGQPVPCSRDEFFLRSSGFTAMVFARWAKDTRTLLAPPVEQEETAQNVDEFDPATVPFEVLSSVPTEPPSAGRRPAPRKRTARKRPPVKASSARTQNRSEGVEAVG